MLRLSRRVRKAVEAALAPLARVYGAEELERYVADCLEVATCEQHLHGMLAAYVTAVCETASLDGVDLLPTSSTLTED